MSRSRGRGKSKKKSDPGAHWRERLNSETTIPGTKMAKQALKGMCTIRSLSATMIYFYNKRFETNRFAIKVM